MNAAPARVLIPLSAAQTAEWRQKIATFHQECLQNLDSFQRAFYAQAASRVYWVVRMTRLDILNAQLWEALYWTMGPILQTSDVLHVQTGEGRPERQAMAINQVLIKQWLHILDGHHVRTPSATYLPRLQLLLANLIERIWRAHYSMGVFEPRKGEATIYDLLQASMDPLPEVTSDLPAGESGWVPRSRAEILRERRALAIFVREVTETHIQQLFYPSPIYRLGGIARNLLRRERRIAVEVRRVFMSVTKGTIADGSEDRISTRIAQYLTGRPGNPLIALPPIHPYWDGRWPATRRDGPMSPEEAAWDEKESREREQRSWELQQAEIHSDREEEARMYYPFYNPHNQGWNPPPTA